LEKRKQNKILQGNFRSNSFINNAAELQKNNIDIKSKIEKKGQELKGEKSIIKKTSLILSDHQNRKGKLDTINVVENKKFSLLNPTTDLSLKPCVNFNLKSKTINLNKNFTSFKKNLNLKVSNNNLKEDNQVNTIDTIYEKGRDNSNSYSESLVHKQKINTINNFKSFKFFQSKQKNEKFDAVSLANNSELQSTYYNTGFEGTTNDFNFNSTASNNMTKPMIRSNTKFFPKLKGKIHISKTNFDDIYNQEESFHSKQSTHSIDNPDFAGNDNQKKKSVYNKRNYLNENDADETNQFNKNIKYKHSLKLISKDKEIISENIMRKISEKTISKNLDFANLSNSSSSGDVGIINFNDNDKNSANIINLNINKPEFNKTFQSNSLGNTVKNFLFNSTTSFNNIKNNLSKKNNFRYSSTDFFDTQVLDFKTLDSKKTLLPHLIKNFNSIESEVTEIKVNLSKTIKGVQTNIDNLDINKNKYQKEIKLNNQNENDMNVFLYGVNGEGYYMSNRKIMKEAEMLKRIKSENILKHKKFFKNRFGLKDNEVKIEIIENGLNNETENKFKQVVDYLYDTEEMKKRAIINIDNLIMKNKMEAVNEKSDEDDLNNSIFNK